MRLFNYSYIIVGVRVPIQSYLDLFRIIHYCKEVPVRSSDHKFCNAEINYVWYLISALRSICKLSYWRYAVACLECSYYEKMFAKNIRRNEFSYFDATKPIRAKLLIFALDFSGGSLFVIELTFCNTFVYVVLL